MKHAAFSVNEPRSAALRALNYSPGVERIRRAPRRRSVPLGGILTAIGPDYGTAFTRRACDPEYGIELLSQTDMFASEPQGRVIRRELIMNHESILRLTQMDRSTRALCHLPKKGLDTRARKERILLYAFRATATGRGLWAHVRHLRQRRCMCPTKPCEPASTHQKNYDLAPRKI